MLDWQRANSIPIVHHDLFGGSVQRDLLRTGRGGSAVRQSTAGRRVRHAKDTLQFLYLDSAVSSPAACPYQSVGPGFKCREMAISKQSIFTPDAAANEHAVRQATRMLRPGQLPPS